MNEQTNSVIINFLDDESKYHYVNYYYSEMLDETNDEEYVYKLECLYEWWEQEQPLLNCIHDNVSYDDNYFLQTMKNMFIN